MIQFIFLKKSKAQFDSMSNEHKKRVIEKLKTLSTHPSIFAILKRLSGFTDTYYRLRIGNIRLILSVKSKTKDDVTFRVVKIGHRREIYR